MVKQIPLSGKHGKGKFALVDDDMYELLSKYSWHYSCGYAYGTPKAKQELGHYPMHRVINNTPEGFHTDHIDRNRLNNIKSNLRTVNPSQNMMNTSAIEGKTSEYKGVSFSSSMSLWASTIQVDGKTIHIGYFRTQRSAAVSYNKAAKKYFGKYANLNNIPNVDIADKPIAKRGHGSSSYKGVILCCGNYGAAVKTNGKTMYIGHFPDEKFAAQIRDSAIVQKSGDKAERYVNFYESLSHPLNLNARYVFKVKPMNDVDFSGIFKPKDGVRWKVAFPVGEKTNRCIFPTAIEAAEHWDKLVLIYRDNICTYLNFPEKLSDYLSEIGDQIISPKPIVVPDLD